jgi:hypothetical protein
MARLYSYIFPRVSLLQFSLTKFDDFNSGALPSTLGSRRANIVFNTHWLAPKLEKQH